MLFNSLKTCFIDGRALERERILKKNNKEKNIEWLNNNEKLYGFSFSSKLQINFYNINWTHESRIKREKTIFFSVHFPKSFSSEWFCWFNRQINFCFSLFFLTNNNVPFFIHNIARTFILLMCSFVLDETTLAPFVCLEKKDHYIIYSIEFDYMHKILSMWHLLQSFIQFQIYIYILNSDISPLIQAKMEYKKL